VPESAASRRSLSPADIALGQRPSDACQAGGLRTTDLPGRLIPLGVTRTSLDRRELTRGGTRWSFAGPAHHVLDASLAVIANHRLRSRQEPHVRGSACPQPRSSMSRSAACASFRVSGRREYSCSAAASVVPPPRSGSVVLDAQVAVVRCPDHSLPVTSGSALIQGTGALDRGCPRRSMLVFDHEGRASKPGATGEAWAVVAAHDWVTACGHAYGRPDWQTSGRSDAAGLCPPRPEPPSLPGHIGGLEATPAASAHTASWGGGYADSRRVTPQDGLDTFTAQRTPNRMIIEEYWAVTTLRRAWQAGEDCPVAS